jgi:hypothetical protein
MTALAAASSSSGSARVVSFIVLGVLVAIVVLAIIKLRPALRARRHEAWRKAGLLPEQLDRSDRSDRPNDDAPR